MVGARELSNAKSAEIWARSIGWQRFKSCSVWPHARMQSPRIIFSPFYSNNIFKLQEITHAYLLHAPLRVEVHGQCISDMLALTEKSPTNNDGPLAVLSVLSGKEFSFSVVMLHYSRPL